MTAKPKPEARINSTAIAQGNAKAIEYARRVVEELFQGSEEKFLEYFPLKVGGEVHRAIFPPEPKHATAKTAAKAKGETKPKAKTPAKPKAKGQAAASPKASPDKTGQANREEWLNRVAADMVPHIERIASEVTGSAQKFGPFRVSCGWPSKGGLPGNKSRVRGQCWDKSCSGSGHAEIYISPVEDKADEVADILSHELVHALLGAAIGHKKPFPQIVKAMGLGGKPTATHATEEFWAWARAIVDKHGDYPHAAIDAARIKKPSKTYLLKMESPCCGSVLRMTQKALDNGGAPFCGCSGEFMEYEQA